MNTRVTVYPRAEVLDPQGKAIGQALSKLGFSEVEDVRAGKSFAIRLATDDPVEAEKRMQKMCRKLLANPIVEDFEIEILADAEPQASAAAGEEE